LYRYIVPVERFIWHSLYRYVVPVERFIWHSLSLIIDAMADLLIRIENEKLSERNSC
jgi:hypothetical protein